MESGITKDCKFDSYENHYRTLVAQNSAACVCSVALRPRRYLTGWVDAATLEVCEKKSRAIKLSRRRHQSPPKKGGQKRVTIGEVENHPEKRETVNQTNRLDKPIGTFQHHLEDTGRYMRDYETERKMIRSKHADTTSDPYQHLSEPKAYRDILAKLCNERLLLKLAIEKKKTKIKLCLTNKSPWASEQKPESILEEISDGETFELVTAKTSKKRRSPRRKRGMKKLNKSGAAGVSCCPESPETNTISLPIIQKSYGKKNKTKTKTESNAAVPDHSSSEETTKLPFIASQSCLDSSLQANCQNFFNLPNINFPLPIQLVHDASRILGSRRSPLKGIDLDPVEGVSIWNQSESVTYSKRRLKESGEQKYLKEKMDGKKGLKARNVALKTSTELAEIRYCTSLLCQKLNAATDPVPGEESLAITNSGTSGPKRHSPKQDHARDPNPDSTNSCHLCRLQQDFDKFSPYTLGETSVEDQIRRSGKVESAISLWPEVLGLQNHLSTQLSTADDKVDAMDALEPSATNEQERQQPLLAGRDWKTDGKFSSSDDEELADLLNSVKQKDWETFRNESLANQKSSVKRLGLGELKTKAGNLKSKAWRPPPPKNWVPEPQPMVITTLSATSSCRVPLAGNTRKFHIDKPIQNVPHFEPSSIQVYSDNPHSP